MFQPRFVRELLNARSPKVEFAENTALIPFATATTNNHEGQQAKRTRRMAAWA
jgi:hypothetical protein